MLNFGYKNFAKDCLNKKLLVKDSRKKTVIFFEKSYSSTKYYVQTEKKYLIYIYSRSM